MSVVLNDVLRPPVDAFLDRLERGLAASGLARAARGLAVKHVEAEIVGEVRARAGGGEPTPAHVAAALDAAGAGARAGEAGEYRRYLKGLLPRRSRCAFWGAVFVGVSILPLVGLLVVLTFFSPAGVRVEADVPREQFHAEVGAGQAGAAEGTMTVLSISDGHGSVRAVTAGGTGVGRVVGLAMPLLPLALGATLLGLIATVDILLSRGRVVGLPTALFDLFFFPVLLLVLTLWMS